MSDTINNLSIEITSNADKAASSLDRLASSAEKLKGAAKGAGENARDMKDEVQDMGNATEKVGEQTGKGISKANSSIKAFMSGMKSAIMPIGAFTKSLVGGAIRGVLGFVGGIARIAKYRFIRSLLKNMGQSFKDLYGYSRMFGTDFAKSMDTITTSLRYLRNSIAAMVAPLINALAPVLDTIVNKVVEVLNWFNELFAALSGASTFTVARRVAATWESTFDSARTSTRKAVDDIKRTILGFDEINKLQDNNDRSSGRGSGSSPYTPGYQTLFEERNVSSGFLGFSNAIENALKDTLSRITMIVSGATLAVGAILAFSGTNVPLGIGMMIAGGAGLGSAVALNWEGLSPQIKQGLMAIEAILGTGLLAVGAILAFTGANIPLGIGLMASGAFTLGSAVSLMWGSALTSGISNVLLNILTTLSLASMAIGAILAFTGVNIPLGIGLIAAGATGTAVSLIWGGALSNGIGNVLKNIATIVSGASLALGAILAFTGANIPLGIGLMVLGATGVAASLMWGTTVTSGIANVIKGIVSIVSVASLAVGAILAFTGVNVPLGVSLLAAGVVGTAASISWGGLVNSGISNTLTNIAAILGAASVAVGAILALSGVNIPVGIAMIAAGASTVAQTVDWNALFGRVSEAWDSIKSATSKAWGIITTTVSTAYNNLKSGISARFTQMKDSVVQSWTTIKSKATSIWAVIENTLSTVWNNLKLGASDKWSTIKTNISNSWKSLKSDASAKWTSIKTTLSTTWGNIKDDAATIWDNMKTNSSSTFSSIKDFASDAWGRTKTALQGFAGWISGGFATLWDNGWNTVVGAFSSIFGKIRDYAKEPINAVIGFINSLISKVELAVNRIRHWLSNAIKIDIPSTTLFSAFGRTVSTPRIYWKPLNLSNIEIRRIQPLAEGGILTMPTMLTPNVMAGEAGREAVLPLDNNTEWMDMLADHIGKRNGGNGREVAILQSILEVLRYMSENPVPAEITSSSVQRALNRSNLRAGVTVVPVGN